MKMSLDARIALAREQVENHYNQCHDLCPEKHRCTLSSKVDHKLHVCSSADCLCHGWHRYANAKMVKSKMIIDVAAL